MADAPAKDAKLLCDGLGVRMSPGSVTEWAGLPQRASREMVRMGLGDLARWWGKAGSLGSELRPSGPKVRICGEEPRWPWRVTERLFMNARVSSIIDSPNAWMEHYPRCSGWRWTVCAGDAAGRSDSGGASGADCGILRRVRVRFPFRWPRRCPCDGDSDPCRPFHASGWPVGWAGIPWQWLLPANL